MSSRVSAQRQEGELIYQSFLFVIIEVLDIDTDLELLFKLEADGWRRQQHRRRRRRQGQRRLNLRRTPRRRAGEKVGEPVMANNYAICDYPMCHSYPCEPSKVAAVGGKRTHLK